MPAPFLLHLIRHAHAIDAEDDAARPLSGRGREQVAGLARFLRHSGAFAPAEIWHSPLDRARETATRLARRLDLHAPLRETAGLLPDDAPGCSRGELPPPARRSRSSATSHTSARLRHCSSAAAPAARGS